MKLIEKKRYPNGKRDVYILGHKCFSYWADKLKGVRRCCDIPKAYAKKLVREKNVRFVHPVGIVFLESTVIGNNCKIFQNVTLGQKVVNGVAYHPVLEDNVTVYANAVVIGNVHIGKNSVIGAGSVVLHDVPANEVWAGNPAHFIRKIESSELQETED